jgi:hypothetical protein
MLLGWLDNEILIVHHPFLNQMSDTGFGEPIVALHGQRSVEMLKIFKPLLVQFARFI